MPQNNIIYEGRRKGTRHNACKTRSQAQVQAPGTGLVDGVCVNGYLATTTRTSSSTPAGTLSVTTPRCMVNGHINHSCKDGSMKAATPRTPRKKESSVSTPFIVSVSDGVRSTGIVENGATHLDNMALLCNSDQMVLEPARSTSVKKRRRWKKFERKKRTSLMPPHEEEDWEKEIQLLEPTKSEKMCFGVEPYGPEDVLHFTLRDLTLKQVDTADLPATAEFCPAVYHPCPFKWSHSSVSTEPGQFADPDA